MAKINLSVTPANDRINSKRENSNADPSSDQEIIINWHVCIIIKSNEKFALRVFFIISISPPGRRKLLLRIFLDTQIALTNPKVTKGGTMEGCDR